ncbi:MAG: MBL fold metallo-hydrolase, partial [Bacteroidetes bacterium]|nr:MBL fold metallo-hydrolase [Bacteroidota bacterium]
MSSIIITKFVFNGFQENTFILSDSEKNAVIFDPGCYDRYEEEQLFAFIQKEGLKVHAILNTHAHIDHVLGVQAVMKRYNCDFYLHTDDLQSLERVKEYASVYGFAGYKPAYSPTHVLQGGEQLSFGKMNFEVLHTPGHAAGHVVYYSKENHLVVNGDVLFLGSYGRTDLPGGDYEVL